MHKNVLSGTIYRLLEIGDEKGQKPLISSTNQKVAGSNPSSRTKTKGNCFRSCLLFWVPAAGGGLHPSILECSGRQSRPSAKVFACGKNACTAHSRRGPEGPPGDSPTTVRQSKISILTVPSKKKDTTYDICRVFLFGFRGPLARSTLR